jgi:glutamate-1-semialdehyde aminotransferase
MFGIGFGEDEPTDLRSWVQTDRELYERIMMGLVERGAMPEIDGAEPWFLCAALSEQDVTDTLNYFEEAVREARRS